MNCEDQDFGLGKAGADLSGCLNAIYQRHEVIEDGNIWVGLRSLADSVFAVAGLCHHFPVGLRLQDPAEPRTHDLVVVGKEDT
jgi:hypothetical protein